MSIDFVRPKRLPEANIQAELYNVLKFNKIESILGYRFKEFRLRADLIVIKNNKIICACEIKSNRDFNKEPNLDTRQFRKYQALGIPIFYCNHMDKIEKVVNLIKDLYYDC